MSRKRSLDSLSDDELLGRLTTLMETHRRLESEVVAHLAEVDERRLYLGEGCSSMHAYCTEVLHLSEAEAYLRIAVARASRRFPILLEMLGDGRLHLSGIAKLAPHLTEENAEALLTRAVHQSKREIEKLVVEISPKPDVPSRIRKLPSPRRRFEERSGELSPGGVESQVTPSETPFEEGQAKAGESGPPKARARFRPSFLAQVVVSSNHSTSVPRLRSSCGTSRGRCDPSPTRIE